MRGMGRILVFAALVLAFSGAVRTVAADPGAAAAAGVVYVSPNGSCYHRADCPRLRFAEPVSVAQAKRAHRPCPVCILAAASGAAVAQPTGAASSPSAARPLAAVEQRAHAEPAVLRASDRIPEATRFRSGHGHGRGFNTAMGALIGAGAGFAFGYAANSDGFFTRAETGGVFSVFGVGVGAVVGLLLPAHTDRARDAGRDTLERARIDIDPQVIAEGYRLGSDMPCAAEAPGVARPAHLEPIDTRSLPAIQATLRRAAEQERAR